MMPKRGSNYIWQHSQDYWQEREEIPSIDLTGAEFVYDRATAGARSKDDALV